VSDAAGEPERRLRIVRGEPSAEELAVVLAIVSAAGASEVPGKASLPVRGRWNDPSHGLRRSLTPGPGGWRAAAT
jgi:hypothetical protein